jgi:hypothetical protein
MSDEAVSSVLVGIFDNIQDSLDYPQGLLILPTVQDCKKYGEMARMLCQFTSIRIRVISEESLCSKCV